MSGHPLLRCSLAAILTASVACLAAPRLEGAVLTWDIQPGDALLTTDGSGTWMDGGGNWNNGITDTVWNSANPDEAIFGSGGTAGTVTVSGTVVAGNLTFNAVTGSYTLTGGTVTLAGAPSITVNSTQATINAVLAGNPAWSKAGAGLLILGGDNTYNGATTISAGTLRMTSLTALGATGGAAAGTTVTGGATLDISVAGQVSNEALTLNGTGVGGAGALLVNATGRWTGAITVSTASTVQVVPGVTWSVGSAASLAVNGLLTKTGLGTMSITGGISSGSGGLTISAGTVDVPDATGRWASGTINVSSGGTFRTAGTGTDTVGAGSGIVVASGGIFDFQQTAAETITSLALNGSGVGGAGALVNSAAVTTGALTVPITLQSDSTIGVTNAAGILTEAGAITGAFNFTKTGLGTLILTSTTNAITGDVVIAAGKVELKPATNNNTAGFNGSKSITVNSGATLQIDTANGLTGNGTGTTQVVPITINAGGVLAALAGTSSHIRGLLTLRGGSVTAPVADVGGFGNLDLDGGVTAGGVATTSVISALSVVNTQATATQFNISPGATNGIDLDVTGTLIDAASLSETPLTKTGTGTLRLGGANTYQTETRVTAGKLLVSGSISGTQNVRVSLNSIIGGNGVVGNIIANVGPNDAGEVSPGEGIGILTATSTQGGNGLKYTLELGTSGSPLYANPAASGNDVLHLTNAATPFANGNLNFSNTVSVYFDHLNDTYRGGFYGFDGQASPAASLQLAISNATYAWYIKDNSGSVFLNGIAYRALPSSSVTISTVAETAAFTTGTVSGAVEQFVVIPEPASISFLFAGAALAFRRQKRAQKA